MQPQASLLLEHWAVLQGGLGFAAEQAQLVDFELFRFVAFEVYPRTELAVARLELVVARPAQAVARLELAAARLELVVARPEQVVAPPAQARAEFVPELHLERLSLEEVEAAPARLAELSWAPES